ncbi:MAG: DUF6432 family protein [Natronomonas sp.]
MEAKREYRDRDDAEVAVLDTLVDRHEEGMTVFELRAGVEIDLTIDDIETALAGLKEAELIVVENDSEATRIYPADRVVPDPEAASTTDDSVSIIDRIRDRIL